MWITKLFQKTDFFIAMFSGDASIKFSNEILPFSLFATFNALVEIYKWFGIVMKGHIQSQPVKS